jgi:hypothetical protein
MLAEINIFHRYINNSGSAHASLNKGVDYGTVPVRAVSFSFGPFLSIVPVAITGETATDQQAVGSVQDAAAFGIGQGTFNL